MLKISQSTQGGSSVWKHGADVADDICFVRNKAAFQGLFGLSPGRTRTLSWGVKKTNKTEACDETFLKIQSDHFSVSHAFSYMHTQNQTHTHTYIYILIFYGVHARLHLLYKVLLELDHRGWDRPREPNSGTMRHARVHSCIPAPPVCPPTSITACGTPPPFSPDGSVSCAGAGPSSPPLDGVVL